MTHVKTSVVSSLTCCGRHTDYVGRAITPVEIFEENPRRQFCISCLKKIVAVSVDIHITVRARTLLRIIRTSRK